MDILGIHIVPDNVVPQIAFLGFAAIAILASIMMITRTNPIHSALWLVLVFFQIAGAYVLLNAPFLAALQVLVYAGAILVLFLFVIMLLQVREGPNLGELHPVQRVASWPVGVILAIEICIVILASRTLTMQPLPTAANTYVNPGGLAPALTAGAAQQPWTQPVIQAVGGSPRALGIDLYTDFLLPFEVASLILLVAVVGAIILAGRLDTRSTEAALDEVPTVGIILVRRTGLGTPQDEQFEREIRPELMGAGRKQPYGTDDSATHAQDPVKEEAGVK